MFFLGQIDVMPNVVHVVKNEEMLSALERHAHCDWGELQIEERDKNAKALVENDYLLSMFHTARPITFWIITNRYRSVTTILLSDPCKLHE